MHESDTAASRILLAVAEATAEDVKEVDAEIERLRARMNAMAAIRQLLARSLGLTEPTQERAAGKPRNSPDLQANRKKIALLAIAGGGRISRKDACLALGISAGDNTIDGWLRHPWFEKRDGMVFLTPQGRAENSED